MKFLYIYYFYKTPLYLAVAKGNPKITTLLLSRPELNVNNKSI